MIQEIGSHHLTVEKAGALRRMLSDSKVDSKVKCRTI
jgi:hypothetical protein